MAPKASAIFLALHGHAGGVGQLEPLCRAVRQDLSIVLPQAWRSLHIHGMSEPVDPGHSWFFTYDNGDPEPATFGDCLMELESLVYELREQNPHLPIVILGIDQGAVLALGLCGVLPDYLAGVVAIGGQVPKIRGWSAPCQDFEGLPVLLIRDTEPNASARSTDEDLQAHNATVTRCTVSGVLQTPVKSAVAVQRWLTPPPCCVPRPSRTWHSATVAD